MERGALGPAAFELYGLVPSEFTRRRDERAKDARLSGDRELADAIKRLKRPSLPAWLANMLVRDRKTQVGRLLELGASMREAQFDLAGDKLRDLSTERRQVLGDLVRDARKLAERYGQRTSEPALRELEETLDASLADARPAEALRAGCLDAPMHHTGFGPFDVDLALGVDPDGEGHRGERRPKHVAKNKRAKEHELAVVEKSLGDARQEIRRNERAARELDKQRRSAEDALQRVSREVEATTARLKTLKSAEVEARSKLRRAEEEWSDAQRAIRAAKTQESRSKTALDKARSGR